MAGKPNRSGRPMTSEDKLKNNKISARLTDSELLEFDNFCVENGYKRADAIRAGIELLINKTK